MSSLRILLPAIKLSAFYFLFVLGIPLLIFTFIFSYFILIPHKDPEMFPLNDSKENYVLKKDHSYYSVHYLGNKRHISSNAYILYSPVEVSSFVDKNIKIEGEFVADDKQCIKERCIKLSTRYVGIKIKSIK